MKNDKNIKSKKGKPFLVWALMGIFLIILIASFFVPDRKADEAQDKQQAFAQCLKDSGAIFYGTFWCTHCNAQKESFGKAQKFLPYVECSTPDGKGQLQVCKDKNIDGYPTWIFADGSRQSGNLPHETLSKKTGCALPE